MSPSPNTEHTPPVSNLALLHQQHRARGRVHDQSQQRGRNTSRYELGRRDRLGERVARIYPREITKSPPSSNRPSSASPPGPAAYNATTSPLLSALGATRDTAAQYTNEWAKSVPYFTNQASPNNGAGIAIAASPPTFHNSPSARDGLFAQQGMSNSPPGSRPLSHPTQISNFGGRLQGSPHDSSGRDRRASMYSHHGGRPISQHFTSNPPLPHQPQAHFYGLPDLNLGLHAAPDHGIQPGECGYFCGFDTLNMAGDEASQVAENILLVGQGGGLDVFRVEKTKLDIIGRLEGLKGAVIGAKILPWTSRRDPLAQSRPLVALTIHGPVLKEGHSNSSGSGSSSVIDDSASESPSRPATVHGDGHAAEVVGYQTSVEIYSLKEKRRVAVLYKTQIAPLLGPIDSPVFASSPPLGDLVVDAKGQFVVVASGSSGELYIFAPYMSNHANHSEIFRCIGKLWTSVQSRERPIKSSASSTAESNQEDVPMEKFQVPIFSLSDRWLAAAPPASSSLLSLEGTALTSPFYERPPGLAYMTAPPQPTTNCAVDAPEGGGLLNRLTREGTQVAIKSAQWAAQKGMQAYKSYMNKTPNGQAAPNYGYDPAQQYFPPTHGHQTQPRQETMVVSIYDLQRLIDAEDNKAKTGLHAIATVPATEGSSFLSFSPSGLMLMTVSKKGDLWDVWDLKRMTSKKARKTTREQVTGPHVRRVARFPRKTIATVVDVIWSAPKIDKVAVVTDKGTLHMHSMPASAFQWPPARRLLPKPAAPKPKEDATSSQSGAIGSAMQALNGTTRPWFDAVRTRTASGGAGFSLSSFGVTPAAGAKAGKAAVAGVGKSINNMRHAGDGRVALPPSTNGIKASSVRWLSGKGRGSIALVSGGIMQIWRIQMRPASSKGRTSTPASISKRKMVEFGLAPIHDSPFPPTIAAQLFSSPEDPEVPQDIFGEWLPRALPSHKSGPTLAPLSFSEIETNPPYQPFYTDRRVTRFVYSRPYTESQHSNSEHLPSIPEPTTNLHHNNDDTPWLFGEDVEAIRISSPAAHTYDIDDEDVMAGVAARVENKLVLRDGEEEVEQVVVTTRRRRVRKDDAEGEEGFFEDDCEVLDWAEDRV